MSTVQYFDPRLRGTAPKHATVGGGPISIIGSSPSLATVLETVEAVAPTDANVLITGETGTGKELIAQRIHNLSQRRDKPLVRVNCAGIPGELFESEFFGHVKGAFTGAIRNRIGRFELADGGTLFLDEVCEIPLELQSKLLRVIQEGEFERVGEETTRSADVRIVAATNRSPYVEVKEGRFREDLYFRLNVIPVSLPPLRDRSADVLELAEHFLDVTCRQFGRGPFTLDQNQRRALLKHDWPGNIRELRNVIERAVALSTSELVAADEWGMRPAAKERRPGGFLTEEEFRETEKRNIKAALRVGGWRVAGPGGAAELLGIPPSTLTNRIRKFGICKPSGALLTE